MVWILESAFQVGFLDFAAMVPVNSSTIVQPSANCNVLFWDLGRIASEMLLIGVLTAALDHQGQDFNASTVPIWASPLSPVM